MLKLISFTDPERNLKVTINNLDLMNGMIIGIEDVNKLKSHKHNVEEVVHVIDHIHVVHHLHLDLHTHHIAHIHLKAVHQDHHLDHLIQVVLYQNLQLIKNVFKKGKPKYQIENISNYY